MVDFGKRACSKLAVEVEHAKELIRFPCGGAPPQGNAVDTADSLFHHAWPIQRHAVPLRVADRESGFAPYGISHCLAGDSRILSDDGSVSREPVRKLHLTVFLKKDKATLEARKFQRQIEETEHYIVNRSAPIELTGSAEEPVQLLEFLRWPARFAWTPKSTQR